jgi:hypothetical protein
MYYNKMRKERRERMKKDGKRTRVKKEKLCYYNSIERKRGVWYMETRKEKASRRTNNEQRRAKRARQTAKHRVRRSMPGLDEA